MVFNHLCHVLQLNGMVHLVYVEKQIGSAWFAVDMRARCEAMTVVSNGETFNDEKSKVQYEILTVSLYLQVQCLAILF